MTEWLSGPPAAGDEDPYDVSFQSTHGLPGRVDQQWEPVVEQLRQQLQEKTQLLAQYEQKAQPAGVDDVQGM